MSITEKEYKRKPAAYWKGKKAVSNREIRNGWGALPAGTVFTITDKNRGFSVRSKPCSCCGFSLQVTKVPHGCLTLVEAPDAGNGD